MTNSIKSSANTYVDYVDDALDYCSTKAKKLATYMRSDAGIENAKTVEKIAKFAIVALFALESTALTLGALAVGIAIRWLAPKQLDSLQKSISTIWQSMPFHATALGLALTMFYAGVLFPVYAGLAAGIELGAYVPVQAPQNS